MQANYVETEHLVFEALCKLWPQPERRPSLRIVAMVSIGAMRVAKEAWRQDGGEAASGGVPTGELRDSRKDRLTEGSEVAVPSG